MSPQSLSTKQLVVVCSHNLEKLVNECKSRSGSTYRICKKETMERLREIDRLGIGIRYDVDMKTAYKKQEFWEVYSGLGPVSGVLVNDDFHKHVRQDLRYLMTLARKIHDKRLAKHCGGAALKMNKLENYIINILA